MKTRTLPHEKYAKALAWCEAHRALLPPHTKFPLMHKETLYAFLQSINVRWSSSRKVWYAVSSLDDHMRIRHNGFSAGVAIGGRVSIRITAVQQEIETIIAEFTELCEALDWHVQVSPKRYPNGNDGYERVYIEVIRKRL